MFEPQFKASEFTLVQHINIVASGALHMGQFGFGDMPPILVPRVKLELLG